MNQSQRNFLVEKIEGSVDVKIRALKDSLPEPPHLVNFIYHKVMSGNFDIQDKDVLKSIITDRCINTPSDKEWNTSTRGGWDKSSKIEFKLADFFIIPAEFQEKIDKYNIETEETRQQINLIQSQADTLIVRIKLASNSTLESMIREVDDMGNISLMDTKLKALT